MKLRSVVCLISLAVACNEGSVEVSTTDVSSVDTSISTDTGGSTTPDMSIPTPDADQTTDMAVTTPDTSAPDMNTMPDVPVTPTNLSPGCTNGAGIPEGENTFMLGGRDRRYIMRLPTNYDPNKPWPLVLALHGNGGSTSYWDGTTGDRNIRGVLQNDAVLVVTEAIEGNWRDYNADPSTWPARVDEELEYFDKVITDASNELCINTDAIFSTGFSGGGSFSGVLGCRRTDIRAIAVGGSVLYFDPADCVGDPAAWITIGTLELVAGREQFRDFFRDHAGCDATASAVSPDPCTAYDNCNAATPVHYCQHPGDHFWPDFGSQAMWDFFAQFVE